MGKNILRTFAFCLIFALLFGVFSYILVPKNNSEEAGIYDHWAKGFLSEPENTIDVLFLGDSELYSCVVPRKIWQNYGITSYTCGTSDQKLYQTESFLHRVFETQTPRLVFLETNILYRDYSYTDTIPHIFEELFPLVRYHNRWKSLTVSDFTDPIAFTHINRDKGYLHLTEVLPADDSNYMTPSDDLAPISSKNIRHVQNILAFCREHDAQLILFSSPNTVNWNYPRHNSVALLAQELGIDFIDMNLMRQEIPIDWSTDTRDRGDHLNHAGASKVSTYLGRYLAQTGLFEDKRTWDAYAAWN